MPSTERTSPLQALTRGRRPRALGVAVATLLPLVGVVALGWNAVALVTLYWFELGVASFWAVVRALFAGRPSEIDSDALLGGPLTARRAALPIPWTDVAIRLSTVVVLLVAAPILAVVWFVVGAVTVGVVAGDGLASEALDTVTLAVIGLFLTEGVTTLVDHFWKREYREHSAQTAIQGVFFRGSAIFVGGIIAVTLIGAATAGTAGTDAKVGAIDPDVVGLPLLLGIVCVKFAFDLGGVYSDRLAAIDESSSVRIGWSDDPPAVQPVDDPLPEAPRRLRPTRLGRLIGGVATLPRHPGLGSVSVICLLVGLLFALGELWVVVALCLAASVVIPVLLVSLDYWLRYGAVEYRVTDDALVAYDTLFESPLWRVEPWDETDLRVERDRVDERLDTATVVIDLRDRTVRAPRLANAEPVLAVFDRRADRSERPDG